MQVERKSVTITTAADGTATGFIDAATGRVLALHYQKASSGNYDDGVDFAITVEGTGDGLWTENNVNASATRYPRAGVHGVDGVAATLDGTRLMRDPVAIANDRIKIVLASGGNAKIGTFVAIIG